MRKIATAVLFFNASSAMGQSGQEVFQNLIQPNTFRPCYEICKQIQDQSAYLFCDMNPRNVAEKIAERDGEILPARWGTRVPGQGTEIVKAIQRAVNSGSPTVNIFGHSVPTSWGTCVASAALLHITPQAAQRPAAIPASTSDPHPKKPADKSFVGKACVITDPDGYLNVRTSPNGQLAGPPVKQDEHIKVVSVDVDSKGRTWARVQIGSGAGAKARGYVLSERIDCSEGNPANRPLTVKQIADSTDDTAKKIADVTDEADLQIAQGPTCVPTDMQGKPCVSGPERSSHQMYSGETLYTLKWEKSAGCTGNFTVKARRNRKDGNTTDNISGTGFSNKGMAEIVCTSNGAKGCSGFGDAWVQCHSSN